MPDSSRRGGTSFDEAEENRVSGRGTEARKGREQQFTSDQARAEGAYDGEVGAPPIEVPRQVRDRVPGRGAGGSPVDAADRLLPHDAPDGLSSSRANESIGEDAIREGDVDTAGMAEEREKGS